MLNKITFVLGLFFIANVEAVSIKALTRDDPIDCENPVDGLYTNDENGITGFNEPCATFTAAEAE